MTNFDYDTTPPQSTMQDAIAAASLTFDRRAAGDEGLVPIESATDGGIIGYALGTAHAQAMVRALNAAEGEYEAEMQYHEHAV